MKKTIFCFITVLLISSAVDAGSPPIWIDKSIEFFHSLGALNEYKHKRHQKYGDVIFVKFPDGTRMCIFKDKQMAKLFYMENCSRASILHDRLIVERVQNTPEELVNRAIVLYDSSKMNSRDQ